MGNSQICEGIHAVACCLCMVLIGGPILIAVGATLLAAANRDVRHRNIEVVQQALNTWNDAASPNGWQQFKQATLFLQLEPGANAPLGTNCSSNSVKMTVENRKLDKYSDEESRFGDLPQIRFLSSFAYPTYVGCRYQATILQQLPGAGNNTTVAVLPRIEQPSVDYDIAVDQAVGTQDCPTRSCPSYYEGSCRYNCETDFLAKFNCIGGQARCRLNDAFFSSFAVKVAAQANGGGLPGQYRLDTSYPDVYGGANILPYGYTRLSAPNISRNLAPGPVFQLANIPPKRGPPSEFLVIVRSSFDPWLAYMAATSGSGYLGEQKKTLVISGVVLVILGCFGTLIWCATAFYAWKMFCSRNRPTSRPTGVEGYAWDLANRYGGQYAPAMGVPVQATDRHGIPTGQPLFVPYGVFQPSVPGQPAPGIPYNSSYPYPPPPYGAPPSGAFAPYAYAGGSYAVHGPPGAGVEMSTNAVGGAQGQGPAQQRQGQPLGQQTPQTPPQPPGGTSVPVGGAGAGSAGAPVAGPPPGAQGHPGAGPNAVPGQGPEGAVPHYSYNYPYVRPAYGQQASGPSVGSAASVLGPNAPGAGLGGQAQPPPAPAAAAPPPLYPQI